MMKSESTENPVQVQETTNGKLVEGHVAVVIGGARGIGRAISKVLAREGAEVAVFYYQGAEAAENLEKQIRAAGKKMMTFRVDVRDVERLCAALAEVRCTLGPIKILVYNAGVSNGMPLLGARIDQMREVFEINFWAAVLASREVLQEMLFSHFGRIIYISSPSGDRGGQQGQSAYAASKAALNALARTLAAEVSSRGNLTVNAVAPGPILTELSNQAFRTIGDQILAATPSERFGTPEDVAEMVAFLASDKASYITGQVVYVDGGFSNKYISRRTRRRNRL